MPESKLTLSFAGSSDAIVNWESYSFAHDYLTPCDGFTFVVGDSSISSDLRALLKGGTQVTLKLDPGNGATPRAIATGFIDQISIDSSRSGTTITIRGRDVFGSLCDAQIDPWSPDFKFNDGDTMMNVLGKVFDQFGITTFFNSDVANRSAITGVNFLTAKLTTYTFEVPELVPGTLLSEGGPQYTASTQTDTVWVDPTNPTDLSQLKVKKMEPLQDETYFEFAEKLAKRFHLHITPSADGTYAIVSVPDYSQAPTYTFTNRLDGVGNNVIRGTFDIDYINQPTAIIGKAIQGGGDNKYVRCQASLINELTGYNLDSSIKVSSLDIVNRIKGLVVSAPRPDLVDNYSRYFQPPVVARGVYLEDKHSKTVDQLVANLRRKLSEHQRKALRLTYTVENHDQNGKAYTYNTVATINDEVLGVQGNWWVESVTYKKTRGSSGTTTDLVLIPLNTLYFGD